MQITEAQNREILLEHGVYVKEACDKCRRLLGPIRFTRDVEKGAWCSRLCRDGVEQSIGACRGCGVALQGKRKGALFCSAVCRMRQNGHHRPNNSKTHIQNTPLTDAIPGFGYVGSLERQTPGKSTGNSHA